MSGAVAELAFAPLVNGGACPVVLVTNELGRLAWPRPAVQHLARGAKHIEGLCALGQAPVSCSSSLWFEEVWVEEGQGLVGVVRNRGDVAGVERVAIGAKGVA